MLPIHHLAEGELAEISFMSGGPSDIQRLHELGLRQGCVIEMVQSGIPCIIRLEGQKLCFRDSEVYGVFVSLPQKE
ncbi:MAG: ferrous iron transport protein A [bacterium]|nr:ferrous iron transport protein A [bacterium]